MSKRRDGWVRSPKIIRLVAELNGFGVGDEVKGLVHFGRGLDDKIVGKIIETGVICKRECDPPSCRAKKGRPCIVSVIDDETQVDWHLDYTEIKAWRPKKA